MFCPDRADIVMVHGVYIHLLVVERFLLFFSVVCNDPLCIHVSKLFDIIRIGNKRTLTCYDLFNAVGEFFPLFFRNRKISS